MSVARFLLPAYAIRYPSHTEELLERNIDPNPKKKDGVHRAAGVYAVLKSNTARLPT